MQDRTLVALVLAVAALAVLAVPAQAAQGVAGIDVYADRTPTTNASERVSLDDYDAGERYAWTVNVTDDYDVVDVTVHDGLNVTRARQMVPLVDGSHFVELHTVNVTDVDRPARVFNLTTGENASTYRLGLPGPGPVNLTLHRDTTAPTVTMGPVRNVTHYSFDVKTETSEPALAALVLDKPDGTTREQPTPSPGIWQRFPVQGLDAETTYRFHVRVWDWSGNQARTSEATVTTQPAPNPPEPTVEPVSPQPNATIGGDDGVVVEARFTSDASPVVASSVQLFFDKQAVERDNFTVEGDRVLYAVPGPLEPRPYSVSVEVPNQAGGTGIARWSFTVEGQAPANSPLGVGAALLALAGVALAGRIRRR